MPKQTREFPLMDFSRGMASKSPKEMIPPNALPYCANVLWDEKNRISKIFGTTALLAAANNAFATNPVWNLYNYVELNGAQNLVIQALKSTVMTLWVLRAAGLNKTTATVTEITPSGVTLATNLRCNFATYKGKLYMLNGSSPLLRWDGNYSNPTEGWSQYHTNSFERFTYLCAFNPSHPRLYAGYSASNPIRVVYTDVNGNDFSTYYESGTQFYDFPTTDGTPITGLCEFQNSLLVFKPKHIYRVHGDPSYGVTITHESDGVGCVHHDSIRKVNDNLVIFMAEDGLWAYGDTRLVASAEDESVRTTPNVIRITSEIDDYWATNATPPKPLNYGTKTWSGATDFAAFTFSDLKTLTPVSTKYPAQIVFVTAGEGDVATQTNIATGAVSLLSYASSSVPACVPYYAQLVKYPATSPYSAPVNAIPTTVKIYTQKQGTIGAGHKLNCYITATKTEEQFNVPDFTKVYAEGQVSGNTNIKHNDWTSITLSYYPSPQNLYDGDGADPPLIAIVIRPEGDDSSNYVLWKYQTATGGTNYGDETTSMINSDHENPAHQSLLDYGFTLSCSAFANTGTAITGAFEVTDASFVRWRNVVVENVDNSFNSYVLGSKLVKIEYALSTDGASWDSYVETVNGGEISGTKKHIKFRLTYLRLNNSWDVGQDSFNLIAVRVMWQNTTALSNLIGSAFWENRYLVAFDFVDSGG